MKTHAKTNVLASLLQQSQSCMTGELFSYPLTPVQTPRHSHCPTPSLWAKSPSSLLLPQKATTLRKKYTEYTFQIKFGGFIMEERVCACECTLWEGEESTRGWLRGWQSLIFSGMLVQDGWAVGTSSALCHAVPQLLSQTKHTYM